MFKIWGRADQWMLRYSTFYVLKSSFIRGRLPFKVVFINSFFWLWYGLLGLCLRFEEDPISGCWDIQIFIFWGHFSLEVFIIQTFLTLVWSPGPMFKIWGRSDWWLLRYSYFHFLRSFSIRSHLPLKFVFIETLVEVGMVPWTYMKNLRKIRSVAAEIS